MKRNIHTMTTRSKEHDILVENAENIIRDLRKTLKNKTDKISELEDRIDKYEQDEHHEALGQMMWKAIVEKQKHDISGLNKDLYEKIKKIKELKNIISELEKTLKNKNEEIKELKFNINFNVERHKIVDLEIKNNYLRKDVLDLKETVRYKNEQISEIQENYNYRNKKISELEKIIKTKQDDIDSLKNRPSKLEIDYMIKDIINKHKMFVELKTFFTNKNVQLMRKYLDLDSLQYRLLNEPTYFGRPDDISESEYDTDDSMPSLISDNEYESECLEEFEEEFDEEVDEEEYPKELKINNYLLSLEENIVELEDQNKNLREHMDDCLEKLEIDLLKKMNEKINNLYEINVQLMKGENCCNISNDNSNPVCLKMEKTKELSCGHYIHQSCHNKYMLKYGINGISTCPKCNYDYRNMIKMPLY